MPWILSEYVLKGLFLGLLTYAAWTMPSHQAALIVAGCIVGGVVLGLGFAAVRFRREQQHLPGRRFAYVLFLLLEYPKQIYGGAIAGLATGILIAPTQSTDPWLLALCAAGGSVAGLCLAALWLIRSRWRRFGFSLAIAAAAVAVALFGIEYWPDTLPEADRRSFGIYLLLGLPFFYLLTFVGEAEESEVEVAAWCAAMAVGVWLIKLTPGIPVLALLIPLALYYVYTTRVLSGLRVFKHVLRGISYARVGQPAAALSTLRRAAQLDPANSLARSAMWLVHRNLQPAEIDADPRLTELVDPNLCIDRAATLLLEPPTEAQVAEARHLLDLVTRRDPNLVAAASYWHSVALLHEKDVQRAASILERLFDKSNWPNDDRVRRSVLFSAWNLALTQHSELAKRCGSSQLALPGRRMEAIDAVERELSNRPQDATAWGLKRILYSQLSAADFGDGPTAFFDFAYCEQLGLALIEDRSRIRQAVEFLTIAAQGLPADAPRLWARVSEAWQSFGDFSAAKLARLQCEAAGLAYGPKQLPEDSRHCYFTTMRLLADDAIANRQFDDAARHLQHFCESDRSGIETLRQLADVHEQRGDALAAVRVIEEALMYNGKDADLLQRKDRYYFSLKPTHAAQQTESNRGFLDVAYCTTKAAQLLANSQTDSEVLEWAEHLVELALALQPDSLPARVLAARVNLRRGRRDQALQLLEDVRDAKTEKFANARDEEAWNLGARLLGDMYLNDLDRPDLAVACYQDFRKSTKSGADTLYKLGLAHERLGESGKAAAFYEQVLSYPEHPLASEARDGLRRVRADR